MWPSRGFFFCPPFLITSRSPRKHSGKRRRARISAPAQGGRSWAATLLGGDLHGTTPIFLR
jgi:hypothetical protein